MKIFYCILAYMFVMLSIGLFSCNPAKKASKFYTKAKEKHLPTVAFLSQKDWPCGISKSDTITTYLPGRTDTINVPQVVEVDCPDTAKGAAAGATIKVPVTVPCKCKEKASDTLVRYITQFEKDPRDSIYYSDQLKSVNKDLVKAEQGSNTWRTVAFIFIGLVALSIFFIIRKFKVL